MSYDIQFVDRRGHQSWDETLEALESVGRQPSVPADLIEAWSRIVPQARAILGDVELFEGDKCLQLTHDESGLQLSIYGGSVSIAVPYWHSGDQAARIMALVYKLSALVEKETGLEAFDPQVGEPLSELSPPDATNLMAEVTDGLQQL